MVGILSRFPFGDFAYFQGANLLLVLGRVDANFSSGLKLDCEVVFLCWISIELKGLFQKTSRKKHLFTANTLKKMLLRWETQMQFECASNSRIRVRQGEQRFKIQ